MLKRPFVLFFIGLIFGAFLVGFLWFGFAIRSGIDSWGEAEVYFDDKARAHISDEKLKPPASAKDVFYFIDGFQDHRIFFSYSDDATTIEEIVATLTGKQLHELEVWRNQVEAGWQRDPDAINSNRSFPASLYDVGRIKRARFYQFPSSQGGGGSHLIIDEDTNRLHYGHWET